MSTKKTKSEAPAPPTPPTGWAWAVAGMIPDERISRDSPEYGKWTRWCLFGIDSRGWLWKDIDTDKPVFLGVPPAMP